MNDLTKIIKSIKVYLETDKLAGISEVFIEGLEKGKDKGVIRDYKGNIRIDKDKEGLTRMDKGLEGLRKSAEGCRWCQLHKRRTNLVFGAGNPKARLMFVGEAPGADEDIQGLPFVGRAGQLLTKMIEAIDMKREDVYIANILKCRPPNNRSPLPEEIEACSHFILEQIDAIQPKVVCCLGKFAAQFLLKSTEPITALRGRFYDFNGVKVMPTFHPAYLLRNPNDKRLVWEDLKKIRHELTRI